MKKHIQEFHAKNALIFPSPNDPKKPLDIRSSWERAVRDAKISNFRFHDLRHTTASYLAMNGSSLLDIAVLLGHKDLQMTKRYALSSLWNKYGIKPIIDIRNMWKDGEEIRSFEKGPHKYKNITYDYKGTVFCHCPQTGEMRKMAYGVLRKNVEH